MNGVKVWTVTEEYENHKDQNISIFDKIMKCRKKHENRSSSHVSADMSKRNELKHFQYRLDASVTLFNKKNR